MNEILTVALPMWKAKNCAWIAMESLCRQETTHLWELIVLEEQDDNRFGWERVEDYKNCLFIHGCISVRYQPLQHWIPLGEKWRMMGQMADPRSLGFLLKGADDYSPPKRLDSTYKLLMSDADWVQTQLRPMYDLKTRRLMIRDMSKETHSKTGAEMAVRTEYMRRLPAGGPKRWVDHWILDHVKKQAVERHGRFQLGIEADGNWHQALEVSGMNTISNWDKTFACPTGSFSLSVESVSSFVPKEIAVELDKLSNKLWSGGSK